MVKGKRWGLVAPVLSLALVAAACGGNDDDGGNGDVGGGNGGGLTGDIFVSGSSTVEPISALVAELFAEENPDVGISVQGPGTGDGFALFCNGETDISDASRTIKDEEAAICEEAGIDYVELEVAIDGLTVMTSPENDAVTCLNFGDLYALMGPESQGFDNWSDANTLAEELGGIGTPYPDQDLVMVAPGEESGTYDTFVEFVFDHFAEERGQEGAARPDYQASALLMAVFLRGLDGSELKTWTEAMIASMLATLDPGDEIVLFEPFYENYNPDAILTGVTPRYVSLRPPHWSFDEAELRAAFSDRTRAIVVNTPNNPTGKVFARHELETIAELCARHDAVAITDEIYEHLTYGDAEQVSMPVAVPDLAGTCVVLNGVAKTYAMTGWRVGWLIGPADVVKAGSNYQSHLTGNVSNVSQRAALAAVSGDLSAAAAMRTAFDRRRQTIVKLLSDVPGFSCPTPKGAFYAYPSVKGLLGKEIRGRRPQTSVELAALILDEVEVAVVPGEAFGTPGYLRLSYALGDEDLVEGVSRIQKRLAEARD